MTENSPAPETKKPRKWWPWAAGLLALIVIGEGTRTPEAEPPPTAPEQVPGGAAVFRLIAGDQVWALLLPAGTPAETWLRIARAKCVAESFCTVHGWTDPLSAPAAMPLTDREVDAQVFTYLINRSSGIDRGLWNCDVFTGRTAEECF